tara:strand:+ start:571 stop:936 length:366 start_codon:yes stop_codon:yes gene_type:complete
MKHGPITQGSCQQLLDDLNRVSMAPQQRIAAGVIVQAVKDACARHVSMVPTRRAHGRIVIGPISASHREVWYRDRGLDTVDANSARLFLSVPSKMLSFWCAVLGINPADVNQVYWSLLRAH